MSRIFQIFYLKDYRKNVDKEVSHRIIDQTNVPFVKTDEWYSDRRAHLQMLQAVISRMAGNSFVIKGWSVTLLAALAAFWYQSQKQHPEILLLLIFVDVLFWLHDAYYLNQERGFREFYNDLIKKDDKEVDFVIRPVRLEGTLKTAISRPILLFTYGVIGLAVILVYMVSYWRF